MDISVSHAPSTYALEIHAVQMSVSVKKKQLSMEHNICCSNEVVLCCYDCFGCITVMYQQHITVKIW